MFWYKPANLAFDLEKLFMDRFFAVVCTCTEVIKRVTSYMATGNEILEKGFGLNLSANQIAGFCIPS